MSDAKGGEAVKTPLWLNNLDTVYSHPPKPFTDAIERFVGENSNSDRGQLEDLQYELRAHLRILRAMAGTLTVEQQQIVADELGIRRAS